jgi:hypothetical protein
VLSALSLVPPGLHVGFAPCASGSGNFVCGPVAKTSSLATPAVFGVGHDLPNAVKSHGGGLNMKHGRAVLYFHF